MLTNDQISSLIIAYLKDELTNDQRALLDDWVNSSGEHRQLLEKMANSEWMADELKKFYSFDQEKNWLEIKERFTGGNVVPMRAQRRWAWVAAVAAMVIGLTFVFITMRERRQENLVAKKGLPVKHDVAAPSRPKAILRLGNGQIVSLDSTGVGELANQGGVDVVKSKDGEISYKGSASLMTYDTLVNPVGGKIVSITLNDGTKVILNSGSSMIFPVAFADKERDVEIAGEAYFEVAKDPSRKFIVTSNGVKTEVFGTHFNVNSYPEDGTCKVTLLEGSVSLVAGKHAQMLVPGQQGTCDLGSLRTVVQPANIDKVVAWKEGIFHFEDDNLQTIAKQLARWYGVDVTFKGKIPDGIYSGIISRSLSLSQVLQILGGAGIQYEIDGKNLTIKAE